MALIVKTIGTATGSAGTGTVTAAASTAVVGVSTLFNTEMKDGSGYPLTMLVSGTLYNVASITDDTHLTLTTAATFTAVAFTRGSRHYSTVQAWEDALPASLVTDGNAQEGDMYNDSEFVTAADTIITSHTTDATNYILLTTGAGQSFRDNASVQTNAVKYNQANGVGLRCTANAQTLFVNGVSNCTTSKIQFRGAVHGVQINGGSATTTIIDGCICDGTGTGSSFGDPPLTVYIARALNCFSIQRGTAATFAMMADYNAKAVNCTAVCPSDIATPTTNAFHVRSDGSTTLINCAGFGCTNATDNSAGTFTTCMTDVASPPTGWTGSKTYGSQFVNTTDASGDWKLKAGADCLNAGTTDTTDIPAAIDAVGTARPQGASWDIGAWELVTAATTTFFNFTQPDLAALLRKPEMQGY